MIINGKNLASELIGELKPFFSERKTALAVISAGDNPAVLSFIKEKSRLAGLLGIEFLHFHFGEEISSKFLRKKINEIGRENFIKGLVVQLPLPLKFNTQYLLNAIPMEKDPDMLNERSFGSFVLGRSKILPPAVSTLKFILEKHQIDPKGKASVVLGAGRLVGLPIAVWLMQQKATVSILNEFSKKAKKFTKKADILISAVGQANLVNRKMVKRGAAVIDFGYSQKNGHFHGDVDGEEVKKRAGLITPTPGGTGPILVAMLFKNLKVLMEKNN